MRDLQTNHSTARQNTNLITYDEIERSNGFSSILREEEIDTRLD